MGESREASDAGERRLGIVRGSRTIADGVLLSIALYGGGLTCTLVDESCWSVGEPVELRYSRAITGLRQVVAVNRLAHAPQA